MSLAHADDTKWASTTQNRYCLLAGFSLLWCWMGAVHPVLQMRKLSGCPWGLQLIAGSSWGKNPHLLTTPPAHTLFGHPHQAAGSETMKCSHSGPLDYPGWRDGYFFKKSEQERTQITHTHLHQLTFTYSMHPSVFWWRAEALWEYGSADWSSVVFLARTTPHNANFRFLQGQFDYLQREESS